MELLELVELIEHLELMEHLELINQNNNYKWKYKEKKY